MDKSSQAPWWTLHSRAFQLFLIAVIAASSLFSRATLGPLQESIRAALHLTDNDIATLQGPALALPLLLAAIPLGIAIDRFSRVWGARIVISANILATCAASMAPDFTTLLAARCIIGVAAPATLILSYALLADLYQPEQRGRATMMVNFGASVGPPAVFVLGGTLLAWFSASPDGWRPSLLIMGAAMSPALLAALLLSEPARRRSREAKLPLAEIAPKLWQYRAIIAVMIFAMTMVNLADGAGLVWAAPTLSRTFNLPPEAVGSVMGMSLLVSGFAGPIIGGLLADYGMKSGGPRRVLAGGSAVAAFAVAAGFFALMPSVGTYGIALTVFLTVGLALDITVTALTVVVIPNDLRGICFSMQFAVGAFVGLGAAPLVVSVLAGQLGGSDEIGSALVWICVSTSLIGAGIFFLGKFLFPAQHHAGHRVDGVLNNANGERDITLPPAFFSKD